MSLPPDVLGVVERTGNAPQLVLPDSQSLQRVLAYPTAETGWLVWSVPM